MAQKGKSDEVALTTDPSTPPLVRELDEVEAAEVRKLNFEAEGR